MSAESRTPSPLPDTTPRIECMNYREHGYVCVRGKGHKGDCGNTPMSESAADSGSGGCEVEGCRRRAPHYHPPAPLRSPAVPPEDVRMVDTEFHRRAPLKATEEGLTNTTPELSPSTRAQTDLLVDIGARCEFSPSSVPSELTEALEDIDAYLEEMPAKTDDWSIGYRAITPFVKSLRILRAEFGRLLSERDGLKQQLQEREG